MTHHLTYCGMDGEGRTVSLAKKDGAREGDLTDYRGQYERQALKAKRFSTMQGSYEPFCKHCGWHWSLHNDDGECPIDVKQRSGRVICHLSDAGNAGHLSRMLNLPYERIRATMQTESAVGT